MKKFHVVYKITNLINDKEYIGVHCTNNLNDDYYGSSIDLCKDIDLLGLANFKREFIFFAKTREEAFLKEKELVTSAYILRKDTYNKQLGGSFTYDMTGWVWIYNEGVDVRKRMPSDSIEEWHLAGWIPLKEIWVHKGSDVKRIPVQQKEKWLSQGYELGCAYNRKRVKIKNDKLNTEKSVRENELSDYLCLGWEIGRLAVNNTALGMIKITNGQDEEKNIMPAELERYIELGWTKGGKTGKKGGRMYIYNPKTLEHKSVYLDLLESFLEAGWQSGNMKSAMIHLYKDGDRNKEKITLRRDEFHLKQYWESCGYNCLKHTQGKKWMYKDNDSTSVDSSQVEYFLKDGWLLGRPKKGSYKKKEDISELRDKG